ncbi:response regulator transcription factor [Singulisphaera sp. PoT]|uniref:response regulator transcription factor n=1 Tax=Singulisphaera sp. PoT TaxID=3411797 RepID=UPI003BF51C81
MIVDDHPAVREGLAIRISTQPDMAVCGEADDVAKALELFEAHTPDIIVIDISLKAGDGLDLIKRIKERDESVLLLVWSMYHESLYAERALRAGAKGYINKVEATSTIIEAIHQLIAGKIYLSDGLREKILNRLVGDANEKPHKSPIETLSNRELEVFRLIGHGLSTGEIATRMSLSNKTVETYRDRVRSKLNITSGTELARQAFQWTLENG